MPRLVRRKPIWERVTSIFNPLDFLLWLSEELETREWDSKAVGTQAGLAMNFIFLLARANSGSSAADDGVFGEDETVSAWMTYLARFLVWSLLFASVANAYYTMFRSRHYRLFEANVEQAPATPSAKRVRVASSPVSSSPLRLLGDMFVPESAEQRAHPDKTRDVWELSVWDPLPACLRLFCLFSPGHVLVYMMFLPLMPLDTRPSVTVFNCLVLQAILSAQLIYLQSRFSQQAKDVSIINKEVFNEYDTKFVRPRLHPVVRDVGTQFTEEESGEVATENVETGTPTTIIKREFHTHPNPNYSKHFDPDGHLNQPVAASTSISNPRLFTPLGPRYSDSLTSPASNLRSSGYRQSLPGGASARFVSPEPTSSVAPSSGISLGGSMGVYAHNRSPLKKAASIDEMNTSRVLSPRNSREMASLEQRDAHTRRERQGSPLKNETRAVSNPFARPVRSDFERYPSRLW